MSVPSEFEIQRALWGWLVGWPDRLGNPTKTPALRPDAIAWHSANGGARNIIEAKRFKEIGVLPGIPDLWFLRHGALYGLELKKPGGTLSDAQRELHPRLITAGAKVAVADTLPIARWQLFTWGLVDNQHIN